MGAEKGEDRDKDVTLGADREEWFYSEPLGSKLSQFVYKKENVMNLSELFGRCCCVLGIAMMMFGTFLVPVNAPAWADPGSGGVGAPGCDHNICWFCGSWAKVNGTWKCYNADQNDDGHCITQGQECANCTRVCEGVEIVLPGEDEPTIECKCKRVP